MFFLCKQWFRVRFWYIEIQKFQFLKSFVSVETICKWRQSTTIFFLEIFDLLCEAISWYSALSINLILYPHFLSNEHVCSSGEKMRPLSSFVYKMKFYMLRFRSLCLSLQCSWFALEVMVMLMRTLRMMCQFDGILLIFYGICSPLRSQIADHSAASLQVMYCVTADSRRSCYIRDMKYDWCDDR